MCIRDRNSVQRIKIDDNKTITYTTKTTEEVHTTTTAAETTTAETIGDITIERKAVQDGMDGSCLVVEADKTLIEHCFFQRSGNKFNVYYPGPIHNAETLMKGYYEGKFQIENEFKGNTVISSHALDNLSFCLQKDGKVEKNRIHGMLAAWMLKDCIVEGNYIINSSCICLLYTSPSPRDATLSRMPSSA